MKHYLEKELQELLNLDNHIFKFIQNHSLDGLWYWDLENPEHEFMDNKFWEVLGFDPQTKEHNPKEWYDLIDPFHLEIAKENLAKRLKDENHPYDQIVRYTGKSGSDVWVRCRGIAIRDGNGKPIRLLGCHNNITELKESELETLELLNSYKALIDTKSLFYIKTDAMGKYTFANDNFLETFGYSRDHIIGSNSLESIYVEDHPKTYEVVKKCFEMPNTAHPVILRKYFKGGVIRSNNWEFYGITDATGHVSEILCVGFEVTELLRQTDDIKRLLDIQAIKNKKLQQHSYITSHNIRNSVANMLGVFELIDKRPEDTGLYINMLKRSVDALNKTVENLNSLLNEEKQASYDKLERLNVKETLDRIIELEYFEVNRLKSTINLNCNDDICLMTLPVFFESVFHNLISNALKHGIDRNNNVVDINVEKIDDSLSIEIRDYGKGFDLPNNAERLFHFGTRLSEEKKGQGIGLFITRHHAELIGSRIEVESNKGAGTSFKVIFDSKYICNEK